MDQSLGPPPVTMDPESLDAMSRNFWNAAILRAGIKLNVFGLLEADSSNAPGLSLNELSQGIGADDRFLHAFLEACVALGLLEQQDDSYRNSPAASSFLIKGKDQYVGDLILHITNHWEGWGRLDQLIMEGRTLLPFEAGFVDVPTYWNDYMLGQHNRATSGQGDELVRSVDLTNKKKMLDLGGGAASYSIALCRANPELQSVVLDQKEPLVLARGLVDEQGLQGQITL